jgi:hypothetical protein
MHVFITLCILKFFRISRKGQHIFPLRSGSSHSTEVPRLVNPCTPTLYFGNGPLVSGIIKFFSSAEIKFVADVRHADITVCNNVGNVLCKFEGMELRKFSSASYSVKTRFDMLPQPVIVDAALPEYKSLWQRPDKEETDILGNVLDHFSVDIIKSSLEGDLVVGEEVRFTQLGSVWRAESNANGSCVTEPQTAISCIR